jgi:hypothetical protein
VTTSDSISLAFRTIKGNRLRTSITVIIMALGIMALIAIITAIQAVNAASGIKKEITGSTTGTRKLRLPAKAV